MSLVNAKLKTKYSSNKVASGYKCSICNIKGCKLWRDYQAFLDYQQLYCVDCALKDQKMEGTFIREDGMRLYDKGKARDLETGAMVDFEQWGDQIKWLVPAVPLENHNTFWGYSSVPEDGVAWWKNLPLRVK